MLSFLLCFSCCGIDPTGISPDAVVTHSAQAGRPAVGRRGVAGCQGDKREARGAIAKWAYTPASRYSSAGGPTISSGCEGQHQLFETSFRSRQCSWGPAFSGDDSIVACRASMQCIAMLRLPCAKVSSFRHHGAWQRRRPRPSRRAIASARPSVHACCRDGRCWTRTAPGKSRVTGCSWCLCAGG